MVNVVGAVSGNCPVIVWIADRARLHRYHLGEATGTDDLLHGCGLGKGKRVRRHADRDWLISVVNNLRLLQVGGSLGQAASNVLE